MKNKLFWFSNKTTANKGLTDKQILDFSNFVIENSQFLDFTKSQIGDLGARIISKLLSDFNGIKSLNLSRNKIGVEGVRALQNLLKYLVDELNLEGINIGGLETKALCDGLQYNTTLKKLNLAFNKINNEDITILIGQCLKINNSLTYLDLCNNKLGGAGAKALSEFLKTNFSLTYLGLSSNGINNEGVNAICESLKVNKVLTTLQLGDNNVKSVGAINFANLLKVNVSLTYLNLANNDIDVDGYQALGESLLSNTNLQVLALNGNKVGDKGLGFISDSLKDNKTLGTLYVNDNKISEEGISKLLKVLTVNEGITELDASENTIHTSGPLGKLFWTIRFTDKFFEPQFLRVRSLVERFTYPKEKKMSEISKILTEYSKTSKLRLKATIENLEKDLPISLEKMEELYIKYSGWNGDTQYMLCNVVPIEIVNYIGDCLAGMYCEEIT